MCTVAHCICVMRNGCDVIAVACCVVREKYGKESVLLTDLEEPNDELLSEGGSCINFVF